jgi:Glycosyltransferase
MWMPSSGLPARFFLWSGKSLGDVSLHIVGKDPPPEVVALGVSADTSCRHPIVIHGHRPEIDALLDGCRLSVAPLRWGAGIKGKVATSLAAGLPCVATSVAVEGAGLVAGQEILVADAPSEIAAAIARIYLDDALWLRNSEAGIAAAERQFSFAAIEKNGRAASGYRHLGPGFTLTAKRLTLRRH